MSHPAPDASPDAPTAAARVEAHPAHLGWRLVALVYDALPIIPLWLIVAGTATAIGAALDHADLTDLPWFGPLLWLALWGIAGLYAVLSWRRGGQTMGMRPWRLQVVDAADGRLVPLGRLWLRYALASLGLAAFGVGLWWCLLDRQHRALHDLAAGTLLVRRTPAPKPSR